MSSEIKGCVVALNNSWVFVCCSAEWEPLESDVEVQWTSVPLKTGHVIWPQNLGGSGPSLHRTQVPLKKLASAKIGQNKTDFRRNLVVIFSRNSPLAMWLSRQILVCLYQLNLDYIPFHEDVKLKAGQHRCIHRCNSQFFQEICRWTPMRETKT